VSELGSISYQAYSNDDTKDAAIYNCLCKCYNELRTYSGKGKKNCNRTTSSNHGSNLEAIENILKDIGKASADIGLSDAENSKPGDTVLEKLRSARKEMAAICNGTIHTLPCTDHLTPCNGRCVPVCDDPAQYP